MVKTVQWLGRNKSIAVLLAVIAYLSIVTFHDEVTTLAIYLRNAIGRDLYNTYLKYFFLVLLLITAWYLARHIYKSSSKWLNITLVILIISMMIFSFRFLMVYSIEAIHFVEYMLLAILLLPVIRSYGETVFWVTILGVLDELFQYFFLVPTFEYFDFNDNVLNMLGAGTGAIMVFIPGGNIIQIKRIKWYRSATILTGLVIFVLFCLLFISGKMTFNPTGLADGASWFSLNREVMPDEFWTKAYPGRVFHILKPFEGIVVIYLLFLSFFGLDYLQRKPL